MTRQNYVIFVQEDAMHLQIVVVVVGGEELGNIVHKNILSRGMMALCELQYYFLYIIVIIYTRSNLQSYNAPANFLPRMVLAIELISQETS